jgi:hypothetical protein
VTRDRSAGLALLLIFFLGHLVYLPHTLEDLDSINFALGVRDFDVARHQPHPPGYPVYMALAKVSTRIMRGLHMSAAAPRGLAIWSAIAGAAALPALLLFFERLEGRRRLAWWATVLMACAPLYWFTALRPLSDMLGFCAAVWTLALLAGRPSLRSLLAGALIAGLAIGIRSQTAVLTVPMLLIALLRVRDGMSRGAAVAAFAVGGIIWGVPLIVASGGVSSYLQALGSQAGEDFSGVVMLWTHHTPRVLAFALANTFIWPWDWWLGIGICVLAVIGCARIAWRAPQAALVLAIAFLPYAVFHLLFQETATTRYALPLLPVMAYGASAALDALGPFLLPAATIGAALISLLLALPASATFAREGAPVFRAFDDMAATAHMGERVDAIGIHASMRRAADWVSPIMPARLARAPHGREWETLVALWRAEPSARVWFVADPQRTDLALFDLHARELARAYRWGFVEPPFVGGARPDNVDWYRMEPPGWMLDRGWSVTAEVGGVTARDGAGPHVSPAIAWLKRRPQEVAVLAGGRHLGTAQSGPVTLTASLNGSLVDSVTLQPGFFLRRLTLKAASLTTSAPYVPLAFSASSTLHAAVSLEQFDAEPPGVPMFGYDAGWQEPEFSTAMGPWRWASERAMLWVRPVDRDLTLRLRGESPRRYFDAAPHVRVLVGDREVASFDPFTDFDRTVTLPDQALRAADGRVVVESSKFFVPGKGGDRRHLALRIFRVSVE